MRVYGQRTGCFLSSKRQTVATSSSSKKITLCRELGSTILFLKSITTTQCYSQILHHLFPWLQSNVYNDSFKIPFKIQKVRPLSILGMKYLYLVRNHMLRYQVQMLRFSFFFPPDFLRKCLTYYELPQCTMQLSMGLELLTFHLYLPCGESYDDQHQMIIFQNALFSGP